MEQHCRHWEGNVSLTDSEVDGEVHNTSYWQALSGGEVVSTGIHKDVLVYVYPSESSSEAGWKIKSREILHVWTKAGGHVIPNGMG